MPKSIILGTIAQNLAELYLHDSDSVVNWLSSEYKFEDVQQSKDRPVILVNYENFYPPVLTEIHEWFINQPCNLKNIYLIMPLTVDCEKWYNNYCDLFNMPKLNVIDLPFYCGAVAPDIKDAIDKFQKSPDDVLQNYFCFYGGHRPTHENEFLSTVFSTLADIGHVEFSAGYNSSDIEFEEYLNHITYYNDIAFVDKILSQRKKATFTPNNVSIDDLIFRLYNQVDTSKSACAVIRETSNNVPFAVFTEKTLRSFLNYQITIPLSYKGVTELENYGFKFLHDIIDFSYQFEPLFYKRVWLAMEQLGKLKETYSLKELSVIINKSHELQHNYNYIKQGTFFQLMHNKLKDRFNG